VDESKWRYGEDLIFRSSWSLVEANEPHGRGNEGADGELDGSACDWMWEDCQDLLVVDVKVDVEEVPSSKESTEVESICKLCRLFPIAGCCRGGLADHRRAEDGWLMWPGFVSDKCI